jgi:hypothetical protein
MFGLPLETTLLIAGCVVPWLALEALFFWRMRKRHGEGDTP